MHRRKFEILRRKLAGAGIEQRDVAKRINRGEAHVSRCMNGKAQWTMDEMYKIMDMLNEPYENMQNLFPKDGICKGITFVPQYD